MSTKGAMPGHIQGGFAVPAPGFPYSNWYDIFSYAGTSSTSTCQKLAGQARANRSSHVLSLLHAYQVRNGRYDVTLVFCPTGIEVSHTCEQQIPRWIQLSTAEPAIRKSVLLHHSRVAFISCLFLSCETPSSRTLADHSLSLDFMI